MARSKRPLTWKAFSSAPEFRRLSDVRLININSVSLPSLAEVRRYSHTLGVLRLALLNPLMGLGQAEHRAFLASILVHDAENVPAFAHLFEYVLAERYEWDHEAVVPELLTGRHHPDRHGHQIFAGQTLKFEKICGRSGIDFDLVLDFANRRHPFSRLIFGSMDFDNLDNVARMNWMMGAGFDLAPITRLAGALSVGASGELRLPKVFEGDVLLWQRLRREAYGVLVFDGPTVAGQAVLSKAISEALSQGFLDLTDWYYGDKELVNVLMHSSSALKKRLQSDSVKPPLHCLLHVVRGDALKQFDGVGRDRVASLIEEFLRARTRRGSRIYGYVFRDRGTFSKSVDFVDPGTRGETWSAGTRSDSLIA